MDNVDPALAAYRHEANELRDAPGEPSENESVDALHARLVATRRAQDRLEAIVGELGLIRSRIRKLVAELEAVYEDAWRSSMLSNRTGEYSSAKAQDATYAAGALTELVNVRRAKRMLADVEETYEFVNLKFRGIDSSRRDIDTRIRIVSLQAQLSR